MSVCKNKYLHFNDDGSIQATDESRGAWSLAKQSNGKYVITNKWSNKNLKAEENGEIAAKDQSTGGWEQFDLKRVENGKYLITTAHNQKNIKAHPDGKVEAVDTGTGWWEQWQLKDLGTSPSTFLLASHHENGDLEAPPSGDRVINSKASNSELVRELWKITKQPDGKYILGNLKKGFNVKASNTGEVGATDSATGTWEEYVIERQSNSNFKFISTHGKAITVGEDGKLTQGGSDTCTEFKIPGFDTESTWAPTTDGTGCKEANVELSPCGTYIADFLDGHKSECSRECNATLNSYTATCAYGQQSDAAKTKYAEMIYDCSLTPSPTPSPTRDPTEVPTPSPTPDPTEIPSPSPTPTPTEEPTTLPPTTDEPSYSPTPTPTEVPTPAPTWDPTEVRRESLPVCLLPRFWGGLCWCVPGWCMSQGRGGRGWFDPC